MDWPAELVRREPTALSQANLKLANTIDRIRFGQFLFFRQSNQLKQYAHEKGVRLLGDLPFFVGADSSDVWAHPTLFLLDQEKRPAYVAGVPPDYFSATGQLWGNPVYDWANLCQSEHQWWIERFRTLLLSVDAIRLDHFRAFESGWHVPADATTAQEGAWQPGPGAVIFNDTRNALGSLPFVAEDLGMITDEVRELRDQFQLPGMRVLQFAFDGSPDNPFLPNNYTDNTVAFTGTHDNNTTKGWYEDLNESQRRIIWESLGRPQVEGEDVAWEFICQTWSSRATLAITPLQDLLNLETNARINVPGVADGNWTWRCTPEMMLSPAFDTLCKLTQQAGRI